MFRAFAIYRIAYRRAQNKLYYTQMCTPMCTPYCTRASWPRVHVPRPRLAATLRSPGRTGNGTEPTRTGRVGREWYNARIPGHGVEPSCANPCTCD